MTMSAEGTNSGHQSGGESSQGNAAGVKEDVTQMAGGCMHLGGMSKDGSHACSIFKGAFSTSQGLPVHASAAQEKVPSAGWLVLVLYLYHRKHLPETGFAFHVCLA